MVTIPKPVLVPVSKLKFHPTNIKIHDSKQLHDLGKLYDWIGFTDPIIADKDNLVWAGNGSLEEAVAKGMKEVSVVYMPEEWTEEQKKVFMLMDNKVNESKYIPENIQIILEDVNPILFEEFKMNLDNFQINMNLKEEEETPPLPVEPKAKLGDIYQLGNHRVMCGDSTKDLDKLMENNTADLVLADPPYGISFQSNGRVKSPKFPVLENDDKINGEFIKNCLQYSTGWFLICTSWKVVSQWIDESKEIGKLSNMIIWNKGGGGLGDLKKHLSNRL